MVPDFLAAGAVIAPLDQEKARLPSCVSGIPAPDQLPLRISFSGFWNLISGKGNRHILYAEFDAFNSGVKFEKLAAFVQGDDVWKAGFLDSGRCRSCRCRIPAKGCPHRRQLKQEDS
ncbi:hypothetical protein [Leisingera sp. ANG-DT]|uniref:hypothetical protein n=1 Tax=Leisingera sp. ANG-DT TaxID=1577897 RepID=UPI0019D3E439|nr:hypothetical protein [Leisingera sp. ANG-DT]